MIYDKIKINKYKEQSTNLFVTRDKIPGMVRGHVGQRRKISSNSDREEVIHLLFASELGPEVSGIDGRVFLDLVGVVLHAKKI